MTVIGYARVSTVDQDLEIQEAALKAAGCEVIRSEKRTGTTTAGREELRTVLDFLRKGDVLTHCFTGRPHGPLDANGKILPEMLDCRERGVLFDVGDGGPHLSLDVAEKCLQQNFLPACA